MSDPTGTIATGLETLDVRGSAEGVRRVTEVATQIGAESIVVGLPLLLSGRRGTAAEAADRFAAALRLRSGLPVTLFDERLTSALSERRAHERGERLGRSKGRVDQGAAIALLESWLQRLSVQRRDAGEGE